MGGVECTLCAAGVHIYGGRGCCSMTMAVAVDVGVLLVGIWGFGGSSGRDMTRKADGVE